MSLVTGQALVPSNKQQKSILFIESTDFADGITPVRVAASSTESPLIDMACAPGRPIRFNLLRDRIAAMICCGLDILCQNKTFRSKNPRSTASRSRGDVKKPPGHKVRCELDQKSYPKGIVISDQEMAKIKILRADFHGEWNYTIRPRNEIDRVVNSRQALIGYPRRLAADSRGRRRQHTYTRTPASQSTGTVSLNDGRCIRRSYSSASFG